MPVEIPFVSGPHFYLISNPGSFAGRHYFGCDRPVTMVPALGVTGRIECENRFANIRCWMTAVFGGDATDAQDLRRGL